MARKYSEEELTRAILLIIDQGMTPAEVSERTGINLRAIQRYRTKYAGTNDKVAIMKDMEAPVVFHRENTIASDEVQKKLDETLLARAKFLDDLFATKQVLLAQIHKLGRKSKNLDALQRSLKTLNDIEAETKPGDEGNNNPAFHAKTVNMFQFFNQQLIQDGYKGPEPSPADIVKGY
jgi:ParB-like chromosome segregation protein Spo0J